MIAYLFIALGMFMRLVPQFQHSELGALFSPILAIALFSGVYLSKKQALTIPLIIMGITDFFIGYYDWRLMASVYGAFLLATLWKKNFVIGSVVMPIIYFLVTNYAVWQFMGWYPMTWQGLYECYLMGLPFLKNSIIGTFIYSSLLFGLYELAKLSIKWTKKSFSYILPR
jgi:hypothetical protein